MSSSNPRPPPVFVADEQFDELFDLAVASDGLGARLLLGELDRAILVGEGDPEGRFARLGDAIRYRDLCSGRDRSAILSTPGQADPGRGRLSVLAPAGAALIGLKPGAKLGWPEPTGRVHMLEMLEVAWR